MNSRIVLTPIRLTAMTTKTIAMNQRSPSMLDAPVQSC